ncbi:MAG: hypothetical protein M0R06_17555 [Sphaerochaeta sp.]|jgi:hypothetical protein|nr:hypothetical protein [Sphaerochaeta sp.]
MSCPIKVIPMAQWCRENISKPKSCVPCVLGPVSSFYLGTLDEHQLDGLKDTLNQAYETRDLLTICEALDSIKSQVTGDIKNRLLEWDCLGQTYVPES